MARIPRGMLLLLLIIRPGPSNQTPARHPKMAKTCTVPPLATTFTAVPAKNPVFILRTSSTILGTFQLFHPSKLTPISAKPFPSPLRANPPQKFIYPDPNPEFAIAETQNFRRELTKKLSNEKETFGHELDAVVNVCAEIFGEFLRTEYGGPGTLLVEPFADMMVALKQKKLPGAPLAARTSLLWAQNYVDRDWEIWNSAPSK